MSLNSVSLGDPAIHPYVFTNAINMRTHTASVRITPEDDNGILIAIYKVDRKTLRAEIVAKFHFNGNEEYELEVSPSLPSPDDH